MNPKSFVSLVLLTLYLAGPLVYADSVPKLINYQGKLTDAAAAALNGEYQLEFRLFDAAVAGNLVWGESRMVTVVNGLFNVALGGAGAQAVEGAAVNDIGFAFGAAERYLETRILAGPGIVAEQILAPRQQMVSVPFALNALHGVPPGTVVPFAGGNVPDGWVPCDARTLNANDERYTALGAAIGTAFNTGTEPSGHFRVPDLRGRAAIGTGAGDTRGPDDPQPATNWLRGMKFGTERHKLTKSEMPSHNHGFHDPGHTHNWGPAQRTPVQYDAGGNRSAYDWWNGNYNEVTSRSFTGISFNAEGGDQPHNNIQPSLALNYIIKL